MNLSSLSGSPYTIICLEVATSKSGNSSYFIGNNGGDVIDLTLHVGYNSTTEWRWGQYGDDLNYDTSRLLFRRCASRPKVNHRQQRRDAVL